MRSTRFQGQDPLTQYSPEERGWIERTAREIARRTSWPLAVARAQAVAEFRRAGGASKVAVLPLSRRRPFGAV